MDGLLDWLRGGAFDARQQAAFEEHELEGNLGRLRLILPLMTSAQLLLVFQLAAVGASRATVEPGDLLLRDAFVLVYAVSTLGGAVLSYGAFRGNDWVKGEMPYWASLAYLLHVSTIAGIDQLSSPKITAFTGATMGIALLVSLPPARILMTYGVGFVAFIAAITTMQHDPEHLAALLRFGTMLVGFACALALFLVGARRRDFRQKLTIDEQREELEALNATLEQRVAEQVVALTRRAEEVERLNAQLQAQVKDRSQALARALRQLAEGASVDDDLEGRLIDDRFAVGRPLASGGMGAVYEGVDTSTGEAVAVKVIRKDGRTPLSVLERFLMEAETAAHLDHPSIVRMLHVDIDEDGTFFQVQELVRGETLRDIVKREGRLSIQATARVVEALCTALAVAHERGVVHRDVKPANVMLIPEEPGLKLLDFGISKLALPEEDSTLFEDSQVSTDRQATRAGAVMGTPQFMAPEQHSDASQVTDRSDLYAVGVTAVLLLTGLLPDAGGRVLLGEVDGADGFIEVVLTCLELDAARRPSAVQVAEKAAEVARGAPTLAELVAASVLRTSTSSDEETLYV